MSKDGSISVADLMAELHADPEWVARDAARQAKRDVAELRFREEEKPIIDDLAKVGIEVQSVWDLVNTNAHYEAAIEILLDHLKRSYHARIRNGLIRAITTKDALGIAGSTIINELRREGEAENRWALANALTVVADKSDKFEIKALLNDPAYQDVGERLGEALKNL
ncbi:MAG: hypothetical protein EOP06_32050 [Proteobacteria bacterium]|nr:MAG: hypothetical protein EOP06_32050 [Pseudomonadota bacterium]